MVAQLRLIALMVGTSGVLTCFGCHDVVGQNADRRAVTQRSSSEAGGALDSDGGTETQLDGVKQEESCNFRDDNGDHQVDEGFQWTVGDWEPIIQTTFCAGYTRAITLSDGRVAISGNDGFGESRDRGFIAVVSPTGELLYEPVWTDIPAPGAGVTSITEGPNGQIAAFYDSTDYAGCTQGCPAVLTRVDADLNLLGSAPVDFPFDVVHAWAVAWAPPAYVVLASERSTAVPYLARIDPETGNRGAVTGLPLVATSWGSLASGQSGVGWLVSGGRSSTAAPLNFGLDGSQQCPQQETALEPTLVAEENSQGIEGDGASRNLVHTFDNNFFATYNGVVDGVTEPQLVRIKCANVIAGPIAAGPQETEALDVAVVEDKSTLVLSGRPEEPFELTLRRLRTDIQPMDPPSDDLVIDTFNFSGTMAVTEEGILLFRVGGCDTKTLDVARITCAEE